MTENERDFKGVWIPKEVWLDSRLNMLEKGILTEIDSLDKDETGCFASNKYLADFCQCSETKVSTAISKLINLGYLYIKSFDGRTRFLKSRLSNFERQDNINYKADTQNLQDNNIVNNKDINLEYIAVLYYLNKKAGTRFKAVESNMKFIKARIKDGYNVDDLKAVIDKKVKEWKGTDFQRFLRPETLFNATKFETYLNGLEAVGQQNKDAGGYMKHNYTDDQLKGIAVNVDEFDEEWKD